MSAALDVVASIYNQATAHLSMMLAVCHNQAERDEVWQQYLQARKNFDTCVNGVFEENDAALDALVGQAQNSAQQLSKIEEHLGDIAKVLNTLTTAVSYGAKIAAKVIDV